MFRQAKGSAPELENFPKDRQADILERLRCFDLITISDEERKDIADKLGEKTRRYRAFRNANGALPPETVALLESADKNFEPEDIVARSTWLFARWPEYLDEVDLGALDKREERLAEARRLAGESGHLHVCDSQLGELFAHAAGEADGSWPCVPVCDALEEIDTEEVEHGFVLGILNRRGVYSKSPFEGGEQERRLSEKYERHSEACCSEWPRVAAAMRSAARNYEEAEKREDAAAELQK